MKIAVIGAGNIGGTLAAKWGAAGHQLSLGVRDPAKPEVQQLIERIGSHARATSVSAAVADADVVLFAVPGAAMTDTLAGLGNALDGKIVLDATNNIGAPVASSVAAIAAAAPKAHVFRAFNIYGFENFADPSFGGTQADLFYAGPDGHAQATTEQLIGDVGLRPIRLGAIDQADLVDAFVRIWFTLAFNQKRGRNIALKLLTR